MASDEDLEEHMNAPLMTRPTNEQAKGVLMTLRSATPDKAFAELHDLERHTTSRWEN